MLPMKSNEYSDWKKLIRFSKKNKFLDLKRSKIGSKKINIGGDDFEVKRKERLNNFGWVFADFFYLKSKMLGKIEYFEF